MKTSRESQGPELSRRDVLRLATGAALTGGAAIAAHRLISPASASGNGTTERKAARRAPAVFVSHGSPMVAVEDDAYTEALASFGRAHRPKAVAVISAHWEASGPIRVTSLGKPELIYDFGGFPPALYRLTWPSPGAPALASSIVDRLGSAGHEAVLDPARGFDHGVWVPLRRMFPDATVPTVAISLTRPRRPEELWKIGEALAPLRDEGVMLLGSGGVVHNLRIIDWNKMAEVAGWAAAFDGWVAERLEGDRSAILGYRDAPNAAHAVPTTEHFDPLFPVLGAGAGEKLENVFAGFHHATLSMRTFALLGA